VLTSGDGVTTPLAYARNLSVRNGTVRNWGGAGVNADNLKSSTYEDLRLDSNTGGGIRTSGNSLISHVVATDNGAHGILMNIWRGEGGTIRDSTASDNALDGIQVLGHTLVVGNTSIRNGAAAIHVSGDGNRIDSNNVANFAPSSLAINVVSAGNVIIRNSIRGVGSDMSIAAGNAVGPLDSSGTPSNPWANIIY
jgi:hypothetical protein